MLDNLKPERLWHYFEKLSGIPRCSKNEAAAVAYLAETAERMGLKWKKDAVGNIVIYKPAFKGCENARTVVLQAHIDMVCEKNENTVHDFCKDPIKLKIADGFVRADGTSLGADNGIGVAACLALAEDNNLRHGPLEFLITVDEETGLTGAAGLDPSLISGRTMINLDTEEDNALYIGCAGGMDSVITKKVPREELKTDMNLFLLTIKGLKGGHSGIDIDTGRASANVLLSRVLYRLVKLCGIQIADMSGGSKRNAIAREASAVIAVRSGELPRVKETVNLLQDAFKTEYSGVEDGIVITSGPAPQTTLGPVTKDAGDCLINLLMSIPHGPLKKSTVVEGLVETSSNFAILSMSADSVRIDTSQRSSVESQMDWAGELLAAKASLAGAEIIQAGRYPGWKPDPGSEILGTCRAIYKELFGSEPEVKAVHAGLECGLLGKKVPGMDMVSLGPNIYHPHSPDEKVGIESVGKFWQFLTSILEKAAS